MKVGPYQIERSLAEGGAGRVYRAIGEDGRTVAVKVLRKDGDSTDVAGVARFRREIEALRKVGHASVVPLLDHGDDPSHGPYLVMPLVDGRTLREATLGKKICPEAVILILYALTSGVVAIHRASLVHRDLKPDNVILTNDGKVVLVDLGLALSGHHSRYTGVGTVAGSVPYMSPEQIEGEELGPSTDVWSIGVIGYEMLAGKRPFQRPTQSEEVAAILAGLHEHTSDVDRRVAHELADAIEQCLNADPTKRWRSDALLLRLEGLIDWCGIDKIASELAHVVKDPEAYAKRIAPERVHLAIEKIEKAIARGERLSAMKIADRGLAYAPEEPTLLALVERASRLAEAEAAPDTIKDPDPIPAKPPRAYWPYVTGLALLMAGTGAALGWSTREKPVPVTSIPAAASIAPTVSATEAITTAPTPEKRLFSDLVPLKDPPNDADPKPLSDVAKPGELLVPARLLGASGPAAGLKSIEDQLAKKPGDPDLQVGRALGLLGNGRTKEGLDELDRLAKAYPDNGTVWGAKGYIALRQNKLDDGDDYLSKAIAIDPKDSSSLRNRGILRSHRGKLRDAYADLVAALEIKGDDVEALKELSGVYDRAGHRAEAVPLLERILRHSPNDPNIWVDLSIAQDDLDESLASVKRALALAPEFPRAHKRLCAVYARKEAPEALGACTHALELVPNDPGALNNRAMAYYRAGSDAKALADLDRAIAGDPKDTSYLTNRYLVRSHAGKTADAKADLDLACKLGSAEACNEIAKSK